MIILGIDYGRVKVGLALATSKVASPYKVIGYGDGGELREKIKQICEEEKIEKVVVGISEGEMGEESKKFSLGLGTSLGIPVETFDETLSTQDAQVMAREAGIGRKKRKNLEDAYAAAVILQGYLDVILGYGR